MKLSLAVSALVAGSATALQGSKVGLTCNKLDVNTLSPTARVFLAKAVETTFNDVHQGRDARILSTGSAYMTEGKSLRSSKSGIAYNMVGSEMSTINLSQWQSALESALAKAPHSSVNQASACSLDVSSPEVNSSKVASSSTPVAFDVDVQCDNVDMSHLSGSSLAVVNKALESSFNAVHASMMDDSSYTLDGLQLNLDGSSTKSSAISGTVVGIAYCYQRACTYHCRMCRGDDDSEEDMALVAFQNLFSATLAKESGVFQGIGKCSINMSSSSKAVAAVSKPVPSSIKPVAFDIDVQCDNVDMSHLSGSSLAVVNKALESSFNAVHASMDDSSYTLDGLQLNHDGSSTKSSAISGTVVGIAYCYQRACTYHCRMCRGDDDSEEDMALVAFQNLFSATLAKESGVFQGIGKCSINMSSSSKAIAAVSKPVPSSIKPVAFDVDVQCDNVDMSHLSGSSLAVVNKALESSFNAVHASMMDDSSYTLDGLQLNLDGSSTKSSAISGTVVGIAYCYQRACTYHCRMCRGDDDSEEDMALVAFQNLFSATLTKESGVFQGIGKCSISMTTTSM